MDMEKVITGLELCTNISQDGCLMLCPYKDEKDETYSGFCEQVLKQDAFGLLKEQKGLYKALEQSNAVNEYLNAELEKVREAVKPKSKTRHGATTQVQHWCGACMAMLHGKPNYCPNCGRKVKWE